MVRVVAQAARAGTVKRKAPKLADGFRRCPPSWARPGRAGIRRMHTVLLCKAIMVRRARGCEDCRIGRKNVWKGRLKHRRRLTARTLFYGRVCGPGKQASLFHSAFLPRKVLEKEGAWFPAFWQLTYCMANSILQIWHRGLADRAQVSSRTSLSELTLPSPRQRGKPLVQGGRRSASG